MPSFLKPKAFYKYMISFVLIVALLVHMDIGTLIQQSTDISLTTFSLAVAFSALQIFFLSLRWHHFLNVGTPKTTFQTSNLMNLAGYFANTLFITSVGGIIAKSALAVRHGLHLTQAVFATFLDRFMTLAALIVLSALGLPLLVGTIDQKLLVMLAFTVLSIVAIVTFTLMLLRSGLMKDYILSNRKRSRFIATLRNYTEDYRLMFKSSVLSLLAQICFVLSVFTLAVGTGAFSFSGHVWHFLALLPVLALISSLPISFGGWGVREGAFVYGLSLIGFSMEGAFLLSIQVGLVTLVAPFLMALPYCFKPGVRSSLLSKKLHLKRA